MKSITAPDTRPYFIGQLTPLVSDVGGLSGGEFGLSEGEFGCVFSPGQLLEGRPNDLSSSSTPSRPAASCVTSHSSNPIATTHVYGNEP